MNCNAILTTAKSTLSKATFGIKKHSPEILVIAGIFGTVTSTVMACKATTKVSGIIDDAKDQVDKVHQVLEAENIPEETYSVEDSKKDLAIIYAQTGLKLVKLYAPSFICGTLSLTAMVASNKILKKRNVALAAAYTTLDKAFKGYRGRVVERFGEEIEKEILHGVKAVKVEEKVTDENGKTKTVKKTINVVDHEPYSPYSKIFDEANRNWEKDPEYNLMFVKQIETWANNKLRADGFLFLNQVYEALGFDRTKAGQSVGWIYDENDDTLDNYVDFGLYDIYTHNAQDAERKAAFVNGYERSAILDFNVTGPILEDKRVLKKMRTF